MTINLTFSEGSSSPSWDKGNGNWKFDESVAPIFDGHVRQNVPQYDEIQKMITNLSTWFIEDNSNVYDVGTSTGEVLHNLIGNNSKKDVKFIGVDTSKEMLKKAFIKLGGQAFLLDLDVTDEKFQFANASYIVSMLTMQFISPKDRQQVINKIYNGLNKGGGFVLVEKVVGNNARFNEMWVDMYHDMKLENGLTELEVTRKSRSIRGVLKPYTISENIEILEDAGFKDVDTFFKWGNFVGFLAFK